MKKAKIITVAVIAVLVLILFLQNTETVETRILFGSVTMSRALLLILTFILGFTAGIIATSYMLGRSRKAAAHGKPRA